MFITFQFILWLTSIHTVNLYLHLHHIFDVAVINFPNDINSLNSYFKVKCASNYSNAISRCVNWLRQHEVR